MNSKSIIMHRIYHIPLKLIHIKWYKTMIKRYYSNKILLVKDKISFSGNLNFHGISKDLSINSEIKKTDNKIILSGEFRVSLVDHDVELPTFMMRSIDKEIFVKYQLIFNKIDN